METLCSKHDLHESGWTLEPELALPTPRRIKFNSRGWGGAARRGRWFGFCVLGGWGAGSNGHPLLGAAMLLIACAIVYFFEFKRRLSRLLVKTGMPTGC